MSDAAKLIEKFGLAILGEDPETVLNVLAAFVLGCCERWGMQPEVFVMQLMGPDPDKPLPSASKPS